MIKLVQNYYTSIVKVDIINSKSRYHFKKVLMLMRKASQIQPYTANRAKCILFTLIDNPNVSSSQLLNELKVSIVILKTKID